MGHHEPFQPFTYINWQPAASIFFMDFVSGYYWVNFYAVPFIWNIFVNLFNANDKNQVQWYLSISRAMY
jgi:hypothetical protein